MSQKISGGVGALILAVVVIVIGIISWKVFAPQHGTAPASPLNSADATKMGYGVHMGTAAKSPGAAPTGAPTSH